MSNINFDNIKRNATKYGKPLVKVSDNEQEWELASGKKVKFIEKTISYEELRDNTFVKFEHNGRDQDLLTPENLKRLSSLDHQQYYPAICIKHSDGRYEILDGSSRCAYVLSKKGAIPKFRIMYTSEIIATKDAKKLAKDVRSSLEQHLFEIGKQANILLAEGFTQKEIAGQLGHSQRKISYAVRTQEIPQAVMKLFPIVNELTWSDYKKLIELSPLWPKDLTSIIKSEEIINLKEVNEIIEKLITLVSAIKKDEDLDESKDTQIKKKLKPTKTPLMEFKEGSRQKAQKIISGDTHTVQYRFERLGSEANKLLAQKIAEALELIKEMEIKE